MKCVRLCMCSTHERQCNENRRHRIISDSFHPQPFLVCEHLSECPVICMCVDVRAWIHSVST